MSTTRKVTPNISRNPAGAIVATVADTTHFHQLKEACHRLHRQLPKKITRIGEFTSKSYILITFGHDVTHNEVIKIINEFSYEVD